MSQALRAKLKKKRHDDGGAMNINVIFYSPNDVSPSLEWIYIPSFSALVTNKMKKNIVPRDRAQSPRLNF